MSTLFNDLRFAIRQLFKRPAGTVIILVTLSLVIGTVSLVFGIVQHEHNARMPFPEPDRVVRFWQHTRSGVSQHIRAAVYAQAIGRIRGLESVGAMVNYGSQVMTGKDAAKTLSISYVSPAVFAIIQVPPILGRTFSDADVKSGAETLLVISHAFWQSDFGGDEDIIGRGITLNEVPVTIIGVMPAGIERNGLFYGHVDGWLPKDFESPRESKRTVSIVGRRKAGVSASALNTELATVLPPLFDAFAANEGWDVEALSVIALRADKRPGLRPQPEHLFAFAMPVFILGIAAFNIANILLGRMLVRRHEFALRSALGARRGRLIRQLLVESVLLALLGGVAGVLIAFWVSHWAATQGVPVQFSPLVLGGTLAFTLVAGLVVGCVPIWRATRGDLATDLKEAGGIGSGGGITRHRLRNFLAISQVAMAAALCLGAGLLMRSFQNKRSFEHGFDPSHFVSISTSLTREMYPENVGRGLYAEQVRERLLALPGVSAVSYTSDRVVSRNPSSEGFRLEEQDASRQGQRVFLTITSPNHLELLNVPVVRGRPMQETDQRGSPIVLLVNQSFVKQFFPNEDPIGKRIQVDLEGNETWPTIVGVVADRRNLNEPYDLGPEGYLCSLQLLPDRFSPVFLVQTTPSPSVLRDAIRDAVQSIDAKVPVGDPFPVEAEIEQSVNYLYRNASAVGAIASFGLIMAMIGIYGVVSNSVVERTYEMGVRMAMGASRRDLLRLVIRQGLHYAGIGLGVGLLLGGMTTLGMRDMLFGISPLDMVTYSGVCLLLFATALASCWFPAVRAAKMDPMKALRCE